MMECACAASACPGRAPQITMLDLLLTLLGLLWLWVKLCGLWQGVTVGLSGFTAWVYRANRVGHSPQQEPTYEEQAVPTASGLVAWLWEWLVSTLRLVIWPIGLLINPPDTIHRGIRPILLVHGYRMNWIVWLYMLRRFAQDGHLNVRAVNLPRGTDLETQSVALAHEIDALLARSAARHVDIVAHSMGGVVARLLMQGDYATRIRKLVTLATPHHGTHLAFAGIGPEAAQLSPTSRLLERLNAQPLLDTITSLGSSHDNMILPISAAVYNPDTHVEIALLGHNSMLVSDQVYASVRDILLRQDTHA